MQLLHAERSFLVFLHLLEFFTPSTGILTPHLLNCKTAHDFVQLEIIKESTRYYRLALTRNNNHTPQEQLKQALKDLLIFFSFKKKSSAIINRI